MAQKALERARRDLANISKPNLETKEAAARRDTDAWARPVLVDQTTEDHARFTKLALALAAHDPEISNRLAAETFQEVNERFLDMMQRCLPDVPRKVLVWRLYFLIGGIMMSARRIDRGMGSLSLGACNPEDADEMYRELLAYAAAGFRALSKHR